MKLNVKALALTAGILWALALFLTGLGNLIWSGYGEPFLKVMASVYPGYHANRSTIFFRDAASGSNSTWAFLVEKFTETFFTPAIPFSAFSMVWGHRLQYIPATGISTCSRFTDIISSLC